MSAIKKILIGFGAFVAVLIILWTTSQVFTTFIFSTSSPLSGAPASRGLGTFDSVTTEKASSGESSPPSVLSEGEITARKIVKNGSLSLFVEDVEVAADAIKGVAKQYDGFVSDVRVYEASSNTKVGNVTIRVPADRFDQAMEDIKGFATEVEDERVSTRDVTEQYIDLEARLSNLRSQERQYVSILERAFTVEDILKVTQQLNSVRSSIERMEGQLQVLARQVDMSTIVVSLTADADAEIFGIRWKPLLEVKRSFRSMLTSVTSYVNVMIRIVFLLPALFLWFITTAFVIVIVWRIIGWLRRRWIYHL